MEIKREIERRAFDILDAHPHFHGRAAGFELTCGKEVLVVRGTVRTFYLKQMLQTVLKEVSGIQRIDNQVTVKYDNGLCESQATRTSSGCEIANIEPGARA